MCFFHFEKIKRNHLTTRIMIENLKNKQKEKFTKAPLIFDEIPQYYDMIVFCHLRWKFVYQRPQHIISRMASEIKILLVEEPIGYEQENENTANLVVINPHLHILQPKVHNIESIASVLPKYVKNKHVPIGWFYSPSFSPLLESLNFETVVFDCMDELSLFKGASQQIVDQEKYLVANADIIFTGGKSLYESKQKLHPNVFCFPSSVDRDHFSTIEHTKNIPSDIANIPSPIVGYYGVIDERIDLQLLAETAKNMPEVSFVMIGPLAKIHDNDLPKEDNIHYLGMKTYNELPLYLNTFDIAMMPFALNDATKYISPTKTLEYMAACKPIISTKIADVERDYSACVSLIENADDFCDEVNFLLNQKEGYSMEMQYNKILQNTSWDTTVAKMKVLIKEKQK
jgi:glycosyltransferase involved in cell wall biosynthesis